MSKRFKIFSIEELIELRRNNAIEIRRYYSLLRDPTAPMTDNEREKLALRLRDAQREHIRLGKEIGFLNSEDYKTILKMAELRRRKNDKPA